MLSEDHDITAQLIALSPLSHTSVLPFSSFCHLTRPFRRVSQQLSAILSQCAFPIITYSYLEKLNKAGCFQRIPFRGYILSSLRAYLDVGNLGTTWKVTYISKLTGQNIPNNRSAIFKRSPFGGILCPALFYQLGKLERNLSIQLLKLRTITFLYSGQKHFQALALHFGERLLAVPHLP